MLMSILAGCRLGMFGNAARDGHDLHAVDTRQRVEMLVGKGPFTDHADFHESRLALSSSTISP